MLILVFIIIRTCTWSNEINIDTHLKIYLYLRTGDIIRQNIITKSAFNLLIPCHGIYSPSLLPKLTQNKLHCRNSSDDDEEQERETNDRECWSALKELIQGTTDSQIMDIAEDPEYMIMQNKCFFFYL